MYIIKGKHNIAKVMIPEVYSLDSTTTSQVYANLL